MSREEKTAEEEIVAGFGELRTAVEDRNYARLDSLLARQRELFPSLDPGVASVRNLMQEAQELIWWAMTMLKVQRAGYERSLSNVLKVKRISESYPSRSADLTASMLSVRG